MTRRVLLIAILIVAGGMGACGSESSADVSAGIGGAIAAAPVGAIVVLSEHSNFDWQQLYVFPPYTTRHDITASIGLEWKQFNESGIESRDDVNLVLFTLDDRFVAHALIRRDAGDFRAAPIGPLSPASARFVVRATPDGVRELDVVGGP